MKTLELEFDKIVPEKVQINLREELEITEDIDTEVNEAAGTFGFYAVLAEKADQKMSQIRFECDKWVAEERKRVQTERDLMEYKMFTEPQMMAHLNTTPQYLAYQKLLIKATGQRNMLRCISKAFELKASLVQTKAANRRSEISK